MRKTLKFIKNANKTNYDSLTIVKEVPPGKKLFLTSIVNVFLKLTTQGLSEVKFPNFTPSVS